MLEMTKILFIEPLNIKTESPGQRIRWTVCPRCGNFHDSLLVQIPLYSFVVKDVQIPLFSFLVAEQYLTKERYKFKQIPILTVLSMTRPQGYKIFFMLNSAEHEIYPAYKC